MSFESVTIDILFCFSQERFARKNEEAELRKAFERLDSKGYFILASTCVTRVVIPAFRDGKIDAEELFSLFKWLNHKTSKVRELFFQDLSNLPKNLSQFEVEDIIWEVDDDGDKCINWLEFQAMYRRCRNDSSGALIISPKTTRSDDLLQDLSPVVYSMW